MYGTIAKLYIQGMTKPIKRILGSFNVKVAQKPFLTLGHIFAKPKDRIGEEQSKDTTYSILCSDSDQEYISQTKHQLGTRLNERQKVVCLLKKENLALLENACQTNHTIAWENSRIITTNPKHLQRRYLELWYTNSVPAPLNRDDGGLIPDANLHLVNG